MQKAASASAAQSPTRQHRTTCTTSEPAGLTPGRFVVNPGEHCHDGVSIRLPHQDDQGHRREIQPTARE